MSSSIIIGVPGLWQNRSEIVTSIALTEKFLFIGTLLWEIQTEENCELDIYEHDSDLVRAFDIAGHGYIRKDILQKISEHKYTLYPVAEPASIETATWMLKVGVELLKAGGLAVKVESAGLAHTAEAWRDFAADGSLPALYRAFVTLIMGDDYYYSCGMHNFGLPDASMNRDITAKAAGEILDGFNFYQLTDKPDFQDGHTFSLAPDAPRFRLRHMPYRDYGDSSSLHNPFGRWHLETIQQKPLGFGSKRRS
jgi:hypothetical protein